MGRAKKKPAAGAEAEPPEETPWDRLRQGFGALLEGPLVQSPYADAVGLLARASDPPNVLLYGPRGFPIDLLWREGLRQRFGPAHWQERTLRHITLYECPYAFEIDLANPHHPKEALADREMLPDLIRELVATPPVLSGAAGPAATARHVLVLRNIDRVAHPHVFRVLLERFSHHAWFIATTHALSAIEPPLRSRFLLARVPEPSPAQLVAFRALLRPATGAVTLREMLSATAATAAAAATEKAPAAVAALGARPTLAQARACANSLVAQNVPLRDLAMALLARFPRRRDRLTAVLARIEWHFAQTSRGREPIYHELMIHEAFYGGAASAPT